MTGTVTRPAAAVDGPWARPRVRPEVRLGPAQRRGDQVVHYVKDPETGWYYQLGAKEFFVVQRMDGTRTLDQIGHDYAEQFGRRLGPQNWQQIFTMLASRQLLDGMIEPAALERLRQARIADAAGAPKSVFRKRFAVINPDRLLTAITPRLAVFFSPFFVWPALLASLALTALVLLRGGAMMGDIQAGGSWVGYLPVTLVVTWLILALHEGAHGLTCKHFGGTVPEIGIMWRFPLVAPYCKTDDVVLFRHRRHRVYTAFAGMFVSLLALLPFAAWWALAEPGGWSRGCAAAILLFGAVASLVNLVPFLQLDGYHMLNHALGMEDLRKQTYRYWGRLMRRQWETLRGYRTGDQVAYSLYGLASFAFLLGVCWMLVGYWFSALERWVGPVPATLILVAEAALIAAFVAFGIRHRRSASRAAGREAA